MYVNGNMRPVETIPGRGKRRLKGMMEGVNSSMICLIHCRNFYKCHNVPPPSTRIKKLIKKKKFSNLNEKFTREIRILKLTNTQKGISWKQKVKRKKSQ
jgi:hypothetical protein